MDRVIPLRDGTLLICSLVTSDLPGERITSSLESGLPSAVEMALDVLDGRDRVVAGNRISFRIAFDLWEEIFLVEGVGDVRNFADLDSLAGFFDVLPRLPVTPIAGLEPGARHRVRVGLELHPLAPRESRRLGAWVAGGENREREEVPGSDTREVSVSLGEVIRFFYRGGERTESGAERERFSAWFIPEELDDATD